jgi:hypothetical protein
MKRATAVRALVLSLKAPAERQSKIPVQNGTLTNIFWGLFLIWFGVVTAWLKGDFGAAINAPVFAMGIGVLLLCMNLSRSLLRLRLSVLTMALGVLLTVANLVVIEFNLTIPFLPELLIIAGVALVIGSLRTRDYHAY